MRIGGHDQGDEQEEHRRADEEPRAQVALEAVGRVVRRAAAAAAGGGGLWTQPTTRGPLETPGRNGRCDDTVYVDTTGGSPIPFSGPDGY